MKRVLSVILCLLMILTSTLITSFAASLQKDDTYIAGDANGDGVVNALDSLCIKSYVAGVDNGQSPDTNGADIDADGNITSRDNFCLKSVFSGAKELSSFEGSYQVYSFTIGGKDISSYTISVPTGSSTEDNVYYAAQEFRKYVQSATGKTLSIVKGAKTGSLVAFHAVDYESDEGKELGIEGYKYDVTNGNLNIYGTYRGNMYAVYEILEDYLGFRFYDDDNTFLYKTRCVDIPEGTNRFVFPEIVARHACQAFGNTTDHYFPMRLNFGSGGYVEPKYGLRTGSQFINAHSYGYYWRMATGTMPDESFGTLAQRYQEKYNSGYQQDEYSWLPCMMNGDVYDTLFSGMLDTMAMIQSWGSYIFTPERLSLNIYSMSFSSCDNTNACPCRFCGAVADGTRTRLRYETDAATIQKMYKFGDYEIKNEGNAKYAYFHKEGYSGLMMNHASLAATMLQEYYPGMRVHSILYYHEIPETVRPCQWLNVWYCGTGCNNHWLGSHGCETAKPGQLNYPNSDIKQSNIIDEPALKAWGQFCDEANAQLWFWYYPVTYHYYLVGCPNIRNIYYDYKYLSEECHVDGIYYEGGGRTYNFETLKAYLATRMVWNPHMSYEEFTDVMKEYLYMYYGDGYEYIYDFIMAEEEAGDACDHCFINNYDRPGDMYSLEYIAEHYEDMRAMLENSLALADTNTYKKRINTLIYCFDFLGLSAVYKDWYTNGTSSTKSLYTQRYKAMLKYFNDNNMVIFSSDVYVLPKTEDLTIDPMTQFYEDGSRRPDSAWG